MFCVQCQVLTFTVFFGSSVICVDVRRRVVTAVVLGHIHREAFHNFGGFDRCDLQNKKKQKNRDLGSAGMHFWIFIPEARKGRP